MALILIDYKMPGINGPTLIKLTRLFLESKEVSLDNMPVFAFKGLNFMELMAQESQEIYDLGIKPIDIVDRLQNKYDIVKYFK